MTQSRSLPTHLALEAPEKHSKVQKLIEEKLSPFYKKTMKQVFMYAMGIGFSNGKRTPLKKKNRAIPLTACSNTDKSLIKAIAITEKNSTDVMLQENVREAFEIAEEYANGGIDLLYFQVFGTEPGDPDKKMEQILRDILEKKAGK